MKIFILLAFIFIIFGAYSRPPIKAERYDVLSGNSTNNKNIIFDNKLEMNQGKKPDQFLFENYDYIKSGGSVLDVYMGDGRNAVYLARKGFNVTGIEIRENMIEKARILSKTFDVRITSIKSSINNYNITGELYDAVLCFYYVDKNIINKLFSFLRPGGILIFKTYTKRQKKIKGFKDYPLVNTMEKKEFLKMFEKYNLLKFEDPIHGKSFTSAVIVQKEK